MSSYEISLEKKLEADDPILTAKYTTIVKSLETTNVYTQSKFSFYTPHDFTHSKTIVKCLNWFVLDSLKEKLSSSEIYMLLLSAYFHDIGMIVTQKEKEEKTEEEIRSVHHIRSETILLDNHDDFGLTLGEATILGKICRGHRKEDLFETYFDSLPLDQGNLIRIRYLAALLRISDEFDVTEKRISKFIYKQLDPESRAYEEFTKHSHIGGISYGSENQHHKVILAATVETPEALQLIKTVCEKIQTTIDGIKGILANNGLSLEKIELKKTTHGFIDKPFKFKLQESKIVELLIGSHLYSDETVAIRELIQNSYDAINRRKIKYPNEEYKVIVSHSKPNFLEVEDNGDGMDERSAKEFLSIIGESYKNSLDADEFISKSEVGLISNFGIGFLSCFLIAHKIIIETKKEGHLPCRFIITDSSRIWTYRRGNMKNSGTKVQLHLKSEFLNINVLKIINYYIIMPEYPIILRRNDKEIEFLGKYSLEEKIRHGFHMVDKKRGKFAAKHFKQYSKTKKKYLLTYSCLDEFKLHYLSDGKNNIQSYYFNEVLILNHGIYVCEIIVPFCFSGQYLIDIRKPIIDFDISRSNIVRNQKFDKLKQKISTIILNEWPKIEPDKKKIRQFQNTLLLNRNSKEIPKYILNLISKFYVVAIYSHGILKYQFLKDIPMVNEVISYIPDDEDGCLNELTFLIKSFDFLVENNHIILHYEDDNKFFETLIDFLYSDRKVTKIRFDDVLYPFIEIKKNEYSDILPKELSFFKLKSESSPTLYFSPKIIKYRGGASIDNEILVEYYLNNSLPKNWDEEDPFIIINVEDDFIKNLLKIPFSSHDNEMKIILKHYFALIPYAWPIVDSFIDIFDDLEMHIKNLLDFKDIEPFSVRNRKYFY